MERVRPEHKLRCAEPVFDPGGGGLNVARAVQALGGDACALWTCGGAGGVLLRRLLEAKELPHRPIEVAGETRINTSVREEASDREYRFVMPGPRFSEEELATCLDVVHEACSRCTTLVFSGSLGPHVSPTFYARLVRAAAGQDVQVVVDTHGEALQAAVAEGVSLIKPNLNELSRLVGRDLTDQAEVVEAARALVQEGRVETVVVSLGADGALVVTAEGDEHVPAPQVPVKSRVGAGDSMVGGIVASLDRGRPLPEAVRYGVAAGAAATLRPGTALCRRADTDRLFSQME